MTAPIPGSWPWTGAVVSLLGGLLLDVGVLLLELGHPASGVEHTLLARVEGVAHVASLGVNLTALRGAAGRELVTAGTGNVRHAVGGVNIRLHRRLGPFAVVAGSPATADVNRNLADTTVCHALAFPPPSARLPQRPPGAAMPIPAAGRQARCSGSTCA